MVNAVLARLYRDNAVVHRNGKRRTLCPPGITPEKGEYLYRLVRDLRPRHTLEIGFAYGVSTLFIAEALRENGSGHHVVIDPNERRLFDGLGLAHLEEAGLRRWVTFHEEPAELCLPRLLADGLRVDFAFNDSGHLFDHVITEFVFVARTLRTGALLVFDDVRMPAIDHACRFIAANRRDFADALAPPSGGILRGLFQPRPIPPPPTTTSGSPVMRVFRKVLDDDPRKWDEFEPF
jgi:predicted O-methyltransferase YrrM